jgi:hypothetical protein
MVRAALSWICSTARRIIGVALDGPAHQVPRAVAVTYLRKPPLGWHGLAVGAGGHVAVGQGAGKRAWRGLELEGQDVGESAFPGFDDGARVVRNQSAEHGVGVLGVAQVPGSIAGTCGVPELGHRS